MFESVSYLVIGLALLVYSADKFVVGAAATAKHVGISTMLIGLIVVGFGTSAPEMVVSAIASLEGNSGMALGNAVGSNITNIGLVLGIGLLIVPMTVKGETLRREIPILILITLITFWLLYDLQLSHIDGWLLLSGMLFVTLLIAYFGLREGSDAFAHELESEIELDITLKLSVFFLVLGIVFLPLASQLMVIGATNIAQHFGVSDLVIGLTIVAFGTSLPELAATIASAAKNEHDLAIGNVVGSNMFNLLGVIGISGIIREYEFDAHFLEFDYFYMLILTLSLFVISVYFRAKNKLIPRVTGIVFLLSYVSYMVWLYVSGENSIS
ncbi:calcium/sodium antiporter [Marinicella sp. W31]|uniref:calcium/sodium antiporter n=1 Tax=Marinicella sp. W31 TaxID=3023713 RepID=UPI0037575DCA